MYPRQIPVMWMHRPLQSKKERPFLQRKKQQRTESATEAAGTQIEETTGAVSDDDLIDVTEQESEVKFQFDEEDTSTDDATGEFSQVYTYIIYK